MQSIIELLNQPIVWFITIAVTLGCYMEMIIDRKKPNGLYSEKEYYHELHQMNERLTDKFMGVLKNKK